MRAAVRRNQDKDANVRTDLDAAAAAAPKSSDRRLDMAGFYDELGEYAEASAQYDLWIAAHPDDNRRPVALNGRCWANALAGKALDRALKDCNAALSLRPHTPGFLDSRGLVRVRLGDYPKAIADYDEALKAEPDMAWSHYGRGIAKLRLGQKAAGEADLAQARKLDPKLAEKAAKLGIAP
jgi:tetratricopeptide (TPR) repeat protein